VKETRISAADTGKPVLSADRTKIATVIDVRDGRPYVEPATGINEAVRAKLGWRGEEADDYALERHRIARITDNAVELK
jgi:hypothetical protein